MSSQIPRRISLLAQTVESLRASILSGKWGDYLPAERALCESLGISRSTLRRALEKVSTEGMIDDGGSGKRRRILVTPGPSKVTANEPSQTTHQIVWLTQRSMAEMPSVNVRLIASLQAKLARKGYTMTVAQLPERVQNKPQRHMEQWLKEHHADAWILHWMQESVQRWFNKHQRNACIFGTPAEGVDLASIEFDTTAAMQHAVGHFQHLGHTKIALVRPDNTLVGDLRMENRFNELCVPGCTHTVIRHGTEPVEIENAMIRAFAKGDQAPPTALICHSVEGALFAMTWLQHHRIKIPDQISLVLLRSQPLMRHVYPSIAHYAINEERAVTEIIPQLTDLITAQVSSSVRINLTPEFVKGSSIAQLTQNE